MRQTTMQVRRLLLLAPLALLGCQSGFEKCGKYNWFLCAYDGATDGATSGDSEATGTTPTTQTTMAAVCGDGIVEAPEVCDEGPDNTMSPWEAQKTCADDCMGYAGYCGDDEVNGAEVCDDGPGNTESPWEPQKTCLEGCGGHADHCGDGELNGPEVCDDGADNGDAFTDQAHCNASCTAMVVEFCGDNTCQNHESLMTCPADCTSFCGDGKVQAGEQCDDGMDTQKCNGDCTLSKCGDGYVNMAAGEQCDDGNQIETDACRNDCTSASCGDGIVQAGVEGCDDGNQVDDDACSNDCVPARRVFVTAGTYAAGVIKGVMGADIICQDAAQAVPGLGAPGNTWLAWISGGGSSPSMRIPGANKSFAGWFLLPTGTPVAKGWSGLTSGTLVNPIDRTQSGATPPDPLLAWTNTKADGTSAGASDCSNWTKSDGMQSGYGDVISKTATWTQAATTGCFGSLRLYCLEVSP